MQGKGHCEVLPGLRVRKDDGVLTWDGRIEEKDALCGALALVKNLTVRVVYDGRDSLILVTTKNVVCTLDLGWLLVVDLLKEGLGRGLLHNHIHHVFGHEVMHMLTPNAVDVLVTQVAICVLVRRARLLNRVVPHNILIEILGHHLVAVLRRLILAHLS